MARGYPGIVYPYPAFLPTDVERLSRDSLRRYLHHRLRALDARLRVLSHAHDDVLRGHASAPVWNSHASDNVWEGILELDYLQTMRAAIVETLDAL